MMEQQRPLTLRELVSSSSPLEHFLDRDDFPSEVRNQASQLSPILHYQNIKRIIDHITTCGPEDSRHSYKFPLVASEVLCIEMPDFNEYLFDPPEDQQPLFEHLYSFTNKEDNYVLAGYFSKILISIVKRHCSLQSKYNEHLCRYFFEQEYLGQLIKHLYSKSIIDVVLRLLGLRSKTHDYFTEKEQFLLQVMQQMEKGELNDEIVENVLYLVQALINFENNNPKACEEVKSWIYSDQFLGLVFGTLGNTNRLRKTKARITNLYLKKMNFSEEYLLFRGYINAYTILVLDYIQQKAEEKAKVTLEELHLIDNLDAILNFPIPFEIDRITKCLNHLFSLVKCNTWNNIFHQQVLKISTQLMTNMVSEELLDALSTNLSRFREVSRDNLNQEVGYNQLVRKISFQLTDIYNNSHYRKSEKWEMFEQSMQPLMEMERGYSVGEFAFRPHTIAFAYSKEMALEQYAHFLNQATQIIYESKQEAAVKRTNLSSDENRKSFSKKDISKMPKYLQELNLLMDDPTEEEENNSQQQKQEEQEEQEQQPSSTYTQPSVAPEAFEKEEEVDEHQPMTETTIEQTLQENREVLQYWRKHMHYQLDDLLRDV